jgi:hypothetical protein
VLCSSRPHVNIRRPPIWCSWNLRPEFVDGRIERICDGVCIDHLIRQQVFVKPLSHVRAISVAHRPVDRPLVLILGLSRVYLPHRCNHALEAGVQHGSCKVDDLVRLPCVTLGRLARRQIREPRLVEVQSHQLGHRQLAVAEMEAAVECVCLILSTMAREMNKMGGLDAVRDPLDRCVTCDGVDTALVLARVRCFSNGGHLPLHEPKGLQCTPCGDAVFSNSQYAEAMGGSLRCLFLGVEQCRERRSV